MRVVFLTHYYPPEVGAPQVRIASLARHLAERGVGVTVHTGFPHYPDGKLSPPHRNRLLGRERDGGVEIIRSLIYPAPNRGTWTRLLDHAVFATSALATARASGPADVVVAESPPLFTAAAGVIYARAKGARLVVNVADRWPASAVELGILRQRSLIGAATSLERSVYRAAALITTPTRWLEAALAAEPNATGKVVRIPPSVDALTFAGPRTDGEGPLHVVYAGTVGLAQGLATLIEAARLAGPDVVRVTVAGSGAEWPEVAEMVRRGRVANVQLLGTIPHDQVPGLYAGADAAAVLLRDRPIFEGALPTKMLEAMAAGCPVILSARGESARLIGSNRAGIVVEPEDASRLAEAFRTLAEQPEQRRALGEAGRATVSRDFTRASAVDRWADLLHGLADGQVAT